MKAIRMSVAEYEAHQRWKDRTAPKYARPAPVNDIKSVDFTTHVGGRVLRLRLPWPPSVNHYYVSIPGGGKALTEVARQFRRDVSAIAYREMLAAEVEQFNGPVSVQITLAPPDNRKRDTDNGLKALFDALQHAGIVADDSQIKHHEVSMLAPAIPGESACHVVVRVLA